MTILNQDYIGQSILFIIYNEIHAVEAVESSQDNKRAGHTLGPPQSPFTSYQKEG
jgi:hypothetical protein